MRKDVFIAIVIGFFIGGIAALTITNIPTIFKTAQKSRSEKIAATIPPSSLDNQKVQNTEIPLTVEKPEHEKIVAEKSVTVSGKSKPGNTIVIDTDLESQTASAAADGSFSSKITLGEGTNTLYVASYDETGEKSEKIITVFYTPENL
jgi:hypothetical protein